MLYKLVMDVNIFEEEGNLVVYVVNGLVIIEDFLWDRFDFVLEYDLSGDMKWEEFFCSIRLRVYISLKILVKVFLDK